MKGLIMKLLLLLVMFNCLGMQKAQQITCPSCESVIINIAKAEHVDIEDHVLKIKCAERKKLIVVTSIATVLTAAISTAATLAIHFKNC